MEFIDYYKILELDKHATDADIKKAYRKLARKYHPDLNPNDTAAKIKFQQINEANEVLSDPEKRKKYDKYGKDWKHGEEYEKARQQQQYQTGGQAYSGANMGAEDFSDYFESLFGSGRSRGRQTKFRGQDIQAELQMTLKDAYTTHQQMLKVDKTIRITIPAGVENGQTIKINGHGGPGVNGGPNGDLYLTFQITNDTPFKRQGNDLYTTVDLDLYTAILGGELFVDTFDGSKVKLQVKPETQNGSKVKLKGKGFPVYKKEGEFGDLYLTYQIKIPTQLSDREKELFRQLANRT